MSIVLNASQLKAKSFIQSWWRRESQFAVIEAPAGFGKTAMIFQTLKELNNARPVITAPTNSAVLSLASTIPDRKLANSLKTTYSALGFHFSTKQQQAKLVRTKVPPSLTSANLFVVDEASFIGDKQHLELPGGLQVSLFEAVKQAGLKTIFIGHRSQLPEVDEGSEGASESVVFTKNFPSFSLTIPVRTKTQGLQEAHDYIEKLIYSGESFKNSWKLSTLDWLKFLNSAKFKEQVFDESLAYLCYSNKKVDEVNGKIRRRLFNGTAPFYVGDKVLLTKPVLAFTASLFSTTTENEFFRFAKKLENVPTNTRLTVLGVQERTLLHQEVFELKALSSYGVLYFLYVPKDQEAFARFKKHKEIIAHTARTIKAKEIAWEQFHLLMNAFANVKFSYAMTTHRAQGTTIPNVIVDWPDMIQCGNKVLRSKLLYVAASRSSESLKIL